jgi:hypothetical protein
MLKTHLYVNPSTVGVNENKWSDRIHVYPSPAAGSVNLKFPAEESVTSVRLYSSEGKMVLEKKTESVNEELDVRSLKAGLYFIEILSGELSLCVKKLVISN